MGRFWAKQKVRVQLDFSCGRNTMVRTPVGISYPYSFAEIYPLITLPVHPPGKASKGNRTSDGIFSKKIAATFAVNHVEPRCAKSLGLPIDAPLKRCSIAVVDSAHPKNFCQLGLSIRLLNARTICSSNYHGPRRKTGEPTTFRVLPWNHSFWCPQKKGQNWVPPIDQQNFRYFQCNVQPPFSVESFWPITSPILKIVILPSGSSHES